MCIFRISFVHAGGWGGDMHYAKHVLTHSTNVGWTFRRAFSRNIHLFMNAISDKLVAQYGMAVYVNRLWWKVSSCQVLHESPSLKNKFKKSKSGSWPCQTFLVDNKGDPSALWQRPSADLISHDPINTANKLSQLCWCRPISNLCHLMDDARERQYTNKKPLPQIKSCMMHLTGGVMTKMIWQRSHGVVFVTHADNKRLNIQRETRRCALQTCTQCFQLCTNL